MLHQPPEEPPAQAALCEQRAVFWLRLLDDSVLRLHHHRTKGGALRIVDPLVVHGYAKVPSRAERFHLRIHFFNSAPRGFFALIDAEKYLCNRSIFESGQASVSPMTRQPAQYLAFVPALIGQVKDAAALQSFARFHFVHKRSPIGIGQPTY